MRKPVVIIIILLCILIIPFFFYKKEFFTGDLGKKYTREQLVQNFLEHENDFSDLVILFKNKVPKSNEYTVTVGISKEGKISLIVKPVVIDPANKTIGGENLELSSSKLDTTLSNLGWTMDIIKDLTDKLRRINCNWIKTTEVYGNPIEIYPNQKGWGSFTYRVFEPPVSDSLIQIHGKPVSNSDFGKRTFIDYSSAL